MSSSCKRPVLSKSLARNINVYLVQNLTKMIARKEICCNILQLYNYLYISQNEKLSQFLTNVQAYCMLSSHHIFRIQILIIGHLYVFVPYYSTYKKNNKELRQCVGNLQNEFLICFIYKLSDHCQYHKIFLFKS